jgi:PPOX class probable F420-dependent enzyme
MAPLSHHRLAVGMDVAREALDAPLGALVRPAGIRCRPVALHDEKYVRLTTFKRDGTPVGSPVWIVRLDSGEVGFWTGSESGKVKRLAHTQAVTLQPCDVRGRVKAGSTATKGTARVVQGPELDDIRAKVRAKYGVMTKFTKAIQYVVETFKRPRHPYGDRGVVIALDAAPTDAAGAAGSAPS